MDEQMREKFEAWYSEDGSHPFAVERNADGSYKFIGADEMWQAWKACATALSQPAAAQGDSSHSAGGECGGVQA